MGLSPREARARYDAVIEFAELEEFEELKLKNYSSGMRVRLAFSVAIQVDADILLVDEVLAVGDAAFQQKCFDVFNGMRDEGKTIVFVTHDMGAMKRFCHRALLLERGEPVSSASRARSPTATSRSTSVATRDAASAARRAAATARRASSKPGSRTTRRAHDDGPAGPAGDPASARVDVHGRRGGSRGERVRPQRGAPADRRREHRASTTSAAATSGRARRRSSRSPSTTCWRPAATARCSRSPTRRGPRPDRPLRGGVLLRGHRSRALGRDGRPARCRRASRRERSGAGASPQRESP